VLKNFAKFPQIDQIIPDNLGNEINATPIVRQIFKVVHRRCCLFVLAEVYEAAGGFSTGNKNIAC
jgi:hypothetical protein